MAFAKIVSG